MFEFEFDRGPTNSVSNRAPLPLGPRKRSSPAPSVSGRQVRTAVASPTVLPFRRKSVLQPREEGKRFRQETLREFNAPSDSGRVTLASPNEIPPLPLSLNTSYFKPGEKFKDLPSLPSSPTIDERRLAHVHMASDLSQRIGRLNLVFLFATKHSDLLVQLNSA